MNMKKNITILIIAIIIIAAVLGLVAYQKNIPVEDTTPASGSPRLMSIENYVNSHISELSPEKAVLGGTFYVTAIEASDGTGVVSYEDGHIALVADFTYTADENTGYTITSFKVRK